MSLSTTMQVKTTRFGRLETVEVPDDARLTFPDGLPGFEDQTAFALIEDARYAPFGWLQSLAEPAIRFLVMPAELALAGYQVELSEDELVSLGPLENGAPELLCILTVMDGLRSMTANLRAPLAIDRRTRRGRQGHSARRALRPAPAGLQSSRSNGQR
jgi:flagellar assembly factor FliW